MPYIEEDKSKWIDASYIPDWQEEINYSPLQAQSIPWINSQKLSPISIDGWENIVWDIEWAYTAISQTESEIALKASDSASIKASVVVNSINGWTIRIDAKNIEINWNTIFSIWYDPTTKITSWWAASDINNNTTTISWWKITTSSITTNQLNFTPVQPWSWDNAVNSSWKVTSINWSLITVANINADNIVTWTLTWRTVRTANSWERVEMDWSISRLRFYDSWNIDRWNLRWVTNSLWNWIYSSWILGSFWDIVGLWSFKTNNSYQFWNWVATLWITGVSWSFRPIWYNWTWNYSMLLVTASSSIVNTANKKLKVNVAWIEYWLHAEIA